VLEARSIYFSYGGFSIEDVSIAVERGRLVSIIGPNGAGKSTLLRLMAGLLEPSSGSVTVDGAPLHSLSPRERARLVGYVPPSHTPVFPYRALDFVVSGAAPELGIFDAPTRRHVERARRLLETLGLAEKAEAPYTELSSGQLRLLLVARALMSEPRYLLLDEPTAHLDVKWQVEVLRLVRRLASQGVGVAAVLHDPVQAYYFSDEIVALAGGRVAARGPPGEVVREDVIRRLYGADVRVVDCGWRAIVPRGAGEEI